MSLAEAEGSGGLPIIPNHFTGKRGFAFSNALMTTMIFRAPASAAGGFADEDRKAVLKSAAPGF